MAADILEEHIELNLCNYSHADSARLNSWAIQAYDEIERLRRNLKKTRDLIKELSHWDHMATAGDGSYWLGEIKKCLEETA